MFPRHRCMMTNDRERGIFTVRFCPSSPDGGLTIEVFRITHCESVTLKDVFLLKTELDISKKNPRKQKSVNILLYSSKLSFT